MLKHFLSLSILLALCTMLVSAQQGPRRWDRFRGPNGSGVDDTPGVAYPVEFSATRNVVWKQTGLPYGQSSPIVFGNRVFLTASDSEKLITLCFDARSGRELWRREIRRSGPAARIFKANDAASPTPAADASGVYVFFPDFGLVSYSLDGAKERWRHPLGPFKNFYGMSSSPILKGDLLVLVCDQQVGSFLLAVETSTGKQRWRTLRQGRNISWATPIVYRSVGEAADEIIVLGTEAVDSYYLSTGERRWWLPVKSGGGLATPVTTSDQTLVVTTSGSEEPMMPKWDSVLAQYDKNKDGRLSLEEFKGDPELGEHFGWIDTNDDLFIVEKEWTDAGGSFGDGDYGAFALRPSGSGARGLLAIRGEGSLIKWRVKKNLPYIPAPVVYRDIFYMVKTGGIITAVDPASGRILKQGRTPDAPGEYYASPVAADGKVYLSSEAGKITVLKAGAEWEVLAVNEVGEELHASPALSHGMLYVRTRDTLFCFGAKPSQ